MSDGVSYHWVRISDADLAYILEGPEDGTELNPAETWLEWVDEVIDIVEDGLETA